MSSESIVDALAQALDATGAIIAGVKDDQWSNSTPCPEWNVRALVNHLVFGNNLFADLLSGQPLPPPERLRETRDVDRLGDRPLDAYHAAGSSLLAAFSQPGALDRIFTAPVGPAPGIVLLQIRVTEVLVHGWDLARATAQPARLPAGAARAALDFARSAQAPEVPRNGHPFGPPQEISADAPDIDQLAAYLGRPVLAEPVGKENA